MGEVSFYFLYSKFSSRSNYYIYNHEKDLMIVWIFLENLKNQCEKIVKPPKDLKMN